MLDERLICVRQFASEAMASAAAAQLEENGIQSVVQGAAIKTNLAYYGSIIDDMKLMVHAADADRALAILGPELKPASVPRGEWICPRCSELCEATFDVCWNCAAERPEHAVIVEPAASEIAVPLTPATVEDGSFVESEDDQARRFFRASFVCVPFPPLLAYTLTLSASITPSRLTPSRRREYWIGMVVQVLTIVFWATRFWPVSPF
jgi:hypothetical protein